MTEFHEGQEVEVQRREKSRQGWWPAKIVVFWNRRSGTDRYLVEYPDGTRGKIDEDRIRAVERKMSRQEETEIMRQIMS